ncbi:MAG: hypothetical protein GX491_10845 [Chloroflexi bacterium]|nr:hypothetical protein [Chloroflexota bacterium]
MNEIEHNHVHGNCREYLSSLGEYVDGTLDQNLCAELERHMKDCKRCRIVVNTLKKTIDLYHETADDISLPEDVRQRLFARLNLNDYLK